MARIEPYDTASGKRWRVLYRTPDRRQTTKRGFKTKRDASAFAATIEVDMLQGRYVSPSASRVTIAELAPGWLDTKRAQLAPSSYRSYEIAWRVHVDPRWGSLPAGQITRTAVQTWIAELGAQRSRAVATRALTILSGILAVAVDDKRIASNPATGITTPARARKRRVYLAARDVERLADNSEHPLLVRVLAYSGLRWGEAIALTPADIDHERARIHVHRAVTDVGRQLTVSSPKTPGSTRSVPVPAFLLEQLAEHTRELGRDDLLFPSPSGGFMYSPDVRRGWYARAVRAAGLQRLTIHDLRHTAASLAIRSGAPVLAVQRMLGHTSAAMTLDTYADLFDEDLDDLAARMDKLYRPQS